MANKFFLYWASGSPPCWRVQLVAEEKKIQDFSTKLLTFSNNEQKSDQVLKWNQRGQLPTFVVNDSYSINESLAICEYLERLYKMQGTQLTPDEPKALAKVLQRKYEHQNYSRKLGDFVHYKFRRDPECNEPIDPVKASKLQSELLDELKIWDKYAGEADYIAGDKLSIADLIFFPDLALSVRFGLDLAKTAPKLSKYYERMSKLPSVQNTWPPHWKTSSPPVSLF